MSATPDMPARGRARRYVMCRPSHFTVDYSINPWMNPSRPTNTELALAQWDALKSIYQRLGHIVELMDPQPGLPDMVFTANHATVINGNGLGAQFRMQQRAAEAEHAQRWFAQQKLPSLVRPSLVNEGQGDLLWTGQLLLVGSDFRTDPSAHVEAREALGVPTVGLQLVDANFYHLDTALCVLKEGPLGDSQIAYYPPAFSSGSVAALQRLFPDAIVASEDDALYLGLNAVSDSQHVVLAEEATGLADQLRQRGYEPITVDISELRKAGGGPKCCTLEIHP